ncbi:MAG: TerB family tellurite resistance protein [Sphingomonadales bacterium]|jgi:DnaJ like chaperone protein
MAIWGKIVGGATGFALGGPIGALIGAGVGHAVDRVAFGDHIDDEATRKITFTIGVIALAAKMAKADGEVTLDEVAAFKKLFKVPPYEERNVERVFDLARRATAGYEAYARQIASLFERRAPILEDLLDALFQIASADGVFHPCEIDYLEKVAAIFGFNEADIDRIKARHMGLDQASPYAILGIDPNISDIELKKHYKQLVRETHPDRMMAHGVPEEFISVATERLAAINAAYDKIAKSRGLT